jgi:antitoxin MazE
MDLSNGKRVSAMSVKVQKWGNSLALRIPVQFTSKLGISEGTEMLLDFDDKGGLSLIPVTQKPTLEELLSQITPTNRHKDIDFGKSEGNESL